MYWKEKRLFCCLLLLGCLAGGRSETQYILSTPASLPAGEAAKACVNIANNDETLDVNLVLQHEGQNTTIISENVANSKYFQCADYKVPKSLQAVAVTLLLSAIGKKTQILERKTVVIKPMDKNCIFYVDKPIYKTGQKVQFRIVCLDSQLRPVNMKFPMIYMQDPSRTRIKQWPKQEMEHGVLSLEFQLINDCPLGSYSIIAERENTYSLSRWFTVEQYETPRFRYDVDVPSSISVLTEALNVKISVMYTFGKPVKGQVIVNYCKQSGLYGRRKNCFKEKGDPCSNITGQLNDEGIFKACINLSGQFSGSTGMSIKIDFTIIEQGTGIQVSESRYVWVTTQPANLQYDYNAMNQYYKKNIPYMIAGQLKDEQSNPMPNEDIDIERDGRLIQTVKTDAEGKIFYAMDTTNMVAPNFTIQMSYKNKDQCYYAEWRETDYPTTKYVVYRFYSLTGSGLQVNNLNKELTCGQTHSMEVQYAFSQRGIGDKATSVPIYYQVKSGSKIVHEGHQNVDLTNSMNGSITIEIPVSEAMAPQSYLIIYSMLNGEIVVDTTRLNIEKCFRNKVDMAFSEEKGLPGSPVGVILSGYPNSICGLRAIDERLLLLGRYDGFKAENIHNLFNYYASGYSVGELDVEDPEPQCLEPNQYVFRDGMDYLPVNPSSDGHSYGKLKDVGLIFVTKSKLRKPKVCDPKWEQQKFGVPLAEEASLKFSARTSADAVSAAGAPAGGRSTIETIRSDFSETFMWLMVPLNKDGHASLSEMVPDSITNWKGTAFCVSDEAGFGMTKTEANYTAFLPVFMDATHPGSIIRGEIMLLSGVVNNFMDHCIKVQAKLDPSDEFDAQLTEGTQDACVCPKEQAAFEWELQAKVLGEMTFTATAETNFNGKTCDGPNDDSQPTRRDKVVKTILVESEGIRQERTLSNLIFGNPKLMSTTPVSITLPDNVVPDSASAYVTVVGDIIGISNQNLNDLVQKPYGCGEPNLAQLDPAITVLEYLEAKGKLTNEHREKLKQRIVEGYYSQLQYVSGGAYKLFPSSQKPDAWVTAASFRAFERAKKYMEIDENRQQQTLIWLENLQRLDDGCFKPQRHMFSEPDTVSDVHFTAFLACGLLETKYSLAKNLLEGCLQCLKNASTTNQRIETEAIMAYAFALAGLEEYRKPLMEKLMAKGKDEGGTLHWERDDMPELRPGPFFYPIYSSPEVRITAYMLLNQVWSVKSKNLAASSTKSKPSGAPHNIPQEKMAKMSQTALWLARQLNPNGGLPSSTDTMVGLQSLTAFAKLMNISDAQQIVKVKGNNGEIVKFELTPENGLLVQRHDLPSVHDAYTIDVEGEGWSLVQTTAIYYTQIPKENAAFSLDVTSTSESCLNEVARAIDLNISLSYQGNREASGLTIVKCRMLSGYNTDYSSLRKLVQDKIVSKAQENTKGELVIYLTSVTKGKTIYIPLKILMGPMVMNVKSSSCQVYDYYEQGENGYGSYDHPCKKN